MPRSIWMQVGSRAAAVPSSLTALVALQQAATLSCCFAFGSIAPVATAKPCNCALLDAVLDSERLQVLGE